MPERREPNPLRWMGVGLELAGVIVVMVAIGYGVDHWLGSRPWGVVIFALIGVVGGLYNIIKDVIRENR